MGGGGGGEGVTLEGARTGDGERMKRWKSGEESNVEVGREGTGWKREGVGSDVIVVVVEVEVDVDVDVEVEEELVVGSVVEVEGTRDGGGDEGIRDGSGGIGQRENMGEGGADEVVVVCGV